MSDQIRTRKGTPEGTLNVVIAALGGEGGGVLAQWIADSARREGWHTQNTSVPGVAQRTGATIYYIEMFPAASDKPVMSLFPTEGDVDLVIASEIVEAGRMVQRGLVTPRRTQLIASDHRVYGITEKIDLANGIVDADALSAICKRNAARFIHFDMLALAREHNTVISATLFGAVAGADVLPFSPQTFEQVIQDSGIQVAANLAAFRASRDRTAESSDRSAGHSFQLPRAITPEGAVLLQRIGRFDAAVQTLLLHGVERLVDYQNVAYASSYIDSMEGFATLLTPEKLPDATRRNTDLNTGILCELARYQALWMSFEDIARVAQLKTRPGRLQVIRDEVLAQADQLIYVTEYFAPRVEEFCAFLPRRLAQRVLGSPSLRRGLSVFTGSRRLRSNTITTYLLLRCVAALRHVRLQTYGYSRERSRMDAWLEAIRSCLQADAPADKERALELTRCGCLIKGYGETRARGLEQMRSILELVVTQNTDAASTDASRIESLRQAALADDQGVAFRQAMGANSISSVARG